MGKDKSKASRNRFEASSSSNAAEIVAQSNVGQTGLAAWVSNASSVIPVDTSTDMEGTIFVTLKKLSKKDSKTRIRALSELQALCQDSPEHAAAALLPHWAQVYNKLWIENDARLRVELNNTLEGFVRVWKKDLQPQLKRFLCAWLCCQCDPTKEVSLSATRAFETAFPLHRQNDVLCFARVELVDDLTNNLGHTLHTFSDHPDRPESMDQFVRFVSTSLRACCRLLVSLKKSLADSKHEARSVEFSALVQRLCQGARLPALLQHKQAAVRGAALQLVTALSREWPDIFAGQCSDLATHVVNGLGDSTSQNLTYVWEALLTMLRTNRLAVWTCVQEGALLKRLYTLLRKGCDGSAQVSYPSIVVLLNALPEDATLFTNKSAINTFFESLWAGAGSLNISADNALEPISAAFECCTFLLRKTSHALHCTVIDRGFVFAVTQYLVENECFRAKSPQYVELMGTTLARLVLMQPEALVESWLPHMWRDSTTADSLQRLLSIIGATVKLELVSDSESSTFASHLVPFVLRLVQGADAFDQDRAITLIAAVAPSFGKTAPASEVKARILTFLSTQLHSRELSVPLVQSMASIFAHLHQNSCLEQAIATMVLDVSQPTDAELRFLSSLVTLISSKPLSSGTAFTDLVHSVVISDTLSGQRWQFLIDVIQSPAVLLQPETIRAVLEKGSEPSDQQNVAVQALFMILVHVEDPQAQKIALFAIVRQALEGSHTALTICDQLLTTSLPRPLQSDPDVEQILASSLSSDTCEWARVFTGVGHVLVQPDSNEWDILARVVSRINMSNPSATQLMTMSNHICDLSSLMKDLRAGCKSAANLEILFQAILDLAFRTVVVEIPADILAGELLVSVLKLQILSSPLADSLRLFWSWPLSSKLRETIVAPAVTSLAENQDVAVSVSTLIPAVAFELSNHNSAHVRQWAFDAGSSPRDLTPLAYSGLVCAFDEGALFKLPEVSELIYRLLNDPHPPVRKLALLLTGLDEFPSSIEMCSALANKLLLPTVDFSLSSGQSALACRFLQLMLAGDVDEHCAIFVTSTSMDVPSFFASLCRQCSSHLAAVQQVPLQRHFEELGSLVTLAHLVIGDHESVETTADLLDARQALLGDLSHLFFALLSSTWADWHEDIVAVGHVLVDHLCQVLDLLQSYETLNQGSVDMLFSLLANGSFDIEVVRTSARLLSLYLTNEHVSSLCEILLEEARQVGTKSDFDEGSRCGIVSALFPPVFIPALDFPNPSLEHKLASLMCWRLVLTVFQRLPADEDILIAEYLEWIEEGGRFARMMTTVSDTVLTDTSFDFDSWLQGEVIKSVHVNEVVASLSRQLFTTALNCLPILSRAWYNTLTNRKTLNDLSNFASSYVSRSIISREMEAINNIQLDPFDEDELQVRASPATLQVTAEYKKGEDAVLEVVLSLAEDHPLTAVSVSMGKRDGVNDARARKWMILITKLLGVNNGSLTSVIHLWKRNVDKMFEGIEECPICYSTIHMTTHSLPQRECRTCHNKFHKACLLKWFSTSHKSVCPLCQTNFL